jgi:hypothetical protein
LSLLWSRGPDQLRAGAPANRACRPSGSLVFDKPQSLRRILLEFEETNIERTQEFVLRWSSADGSLREIVRQQWNFSPDGSTTETEEYIVHLQAVSGLELMANPDVSNSSVYATLKRWKIA